MHEHPCAAHLLFGGFRMLGYHAGLGKAMRTLMDARFSQAHLVDSLVREPLNQLICGYVMLCFNNNIKRTLLVVVEKSAHIDT